MNSELGGGAFDMAYIEDIPVIELAGIPETMRWTAGGAKEAAMVKRNRGPGGDRGWAVATGAINEVISICHVLTEKLLGLSDFSVPHLKLIRTEEVHNALPKLVPMG